MAIATMEIAHTLGLDEEDLFKDAIQSLLLDRKRQVLQARLETLARYGAISQEDMEAKIASGQVVEHPAWEDLIVAENLTAHLEEIDGHIHRLREAG